MKEITIPISDHYCLVSETDRVYEQGQGGYLCDTTFQYELETARTNGGKILFATSSIEQKLDFVISSYFFDLNQQDNPKKTFFETEVLSLSNFTFSTKRKIFLKIINNAHLINGAKKDKLERNLKKIMDYRNTFAHGKLIFNFIEDCTKINYYQSENRFNILDENYWNDVENVFKECTYFTPEVN